MSERRAGARSLYEDLLSRWCDALLAHQVREVRTPGAFGGILCPLCSRIHGRSADAIHPFLRMAKTTGDARYLDAAVRLQAWSDHVGRSDGSWVNEAVGNDWKGITVFGLLAHAESLRHHGALLDATVRQRWEERLARAARFVFDLMQISTGNINYPISGAAALAIAGPMLGEPRYGRRARELARASLAYISKGNKLLFGEGKPQDGVTAGGCRAVDLGYNVEESLPNFALYVKVTNDAEVLGPLVETMRAHLEFLLPDGAWDNSWGTRNFKWSYWGTRTGDGCQGAYALLADQDPRFAAAALRNAQLLDRFTRDGLLAGGLHYPQQGELPCIHHTFCHARGLATVLDNGAPLAPSAAVLPRDVASGVREYSELRTWLAGLGPWRATVTAYDWVYDAEALPAGHASGGALSMLWHSALGPVLLASVTEYGLMEPSNMQPPREGPPVPLTPRVETEEDGVTYRSVNDLTAQVHHQSGPDGIRFEIRGEMKDRRQRGPADPAPFRLEYELANDHVVVRAWPSGARRAWLVLPFVCSRDEPARRIEGGIEIEKPGGRLQVTWNAPEAGTDLSGRVFHPVPGFQALPLAWALSGDPVAVSIRPV
jgi:hypothetical protein